MGREATTRQPPGWWFPARTTGYFLAVAAICLAAVAALGLGELRDANTENSAVRIDRAGRAAVTMFHERVPDSTITSDDGGSPTSITLGSTVALEPDAAWDDLLDVVGGVNQGAANLFRFDPETDSFDRLSTTFRTPEGERVGGSQVEPGLIGASHPAFAAVTRGEPHIGEVPVAGRLRLAYLTPLVDDGGDTLGILAVDVGWVDDLERINGAATRRAAQAAAALLAILAIVCVIVMVTSFRPLRRLTDLAHELGETASSEPSTLIDRRDEIGYLAKGLAKVADLQRSLRERAFTDDLTAIPNRAALLDELERRFELLDEDESEGFVLLIVDLDGFKEINDGLGHQAGDEVLIAFADTLRTRMGPDDFVARLGGDEFAIASRPDRLERLSVSDLAGRIHRVAADAFETSAGDVRVAASVGVALAPLHGSTTKDIISHADLALYDAKRAGGGVTRRYEASFSDTFQRRTRLASDLRETLDEAIDVHYQPIFDPSGRLVAAEALARWTHDEYGPVPPTEFIPIAESHSLIGRLGEVVLDEACRRLAQWSERSELPLKVSVNISALQLSDQSFPDHVRRILHRHDVPAGQLCLELTEGMLIPDAEHPHRAVLDELVRLGVHVAIDDFGTGYSALNYLHELPVHVVKVDRSFLIASGQSPKQTHLLSTIINLAKNLDLQVVLEGIETREHLDLAMANGVDLMQGYLLGRPMTADSLGDILGDQSPHLPLVSQPG